MRLGPGQRSISIPYTTLKIVLILFKKILIKGKVDNFFIKYKIKWVQEMKQIIS